jgi:hypothetical protein
MSQSILEHVVNISPSAASITTKMLSPISTIRCIQRTGFSGIPACHTRARILILHKPLLQTTDDTTALCQRSLFPFFLSHARSRDLRFDVLCVVRHNSIDVQARRWIIASDKLSICGLKRRKKRGVLLMRMQRRCRYNGCRVAGVGSLASNSAMRAPRKDR